MLKPVLCVLVVLIHVGTSLGIPHENRHNGEYVSRGTFPLAKKRAATTDTGPDPASTADLLTRLKLLAYEEKLKEKELKKETKVETKAEKANAKAARDQALFAAYLNSLNSSSAAGVPYASYPLLYPSLPLAAPVAGAAPMPIVPMPMYPAIGLWKKQMFLSQLYAAAALAAQAQLTAATTAAPTTTQQDSIVQINKRDALDARKETVINQITKRYARYLRKKHGDEDKEREKYYKKHGKKGRDEDDDDEDEDDEDEDIRTGLSGSENRDNDDQFPLSSLSGASNKFGTAPGGNSPVAQAGCSGSHIHVCSGTTFYLNSPENIKSSSDDSLPEDLKPDEKDEDNDKQLRKYKSYSEWRKSWRNDEDEDEDRHRKKHGHGHRSRKHKKHGHKKHKHEDEDEEDKRSNEDEREQEQEPDQNQEDNEQDNEKDIEEAEPVTPEAATEEKKA